MTRTTRNAAVRSLITLISQVAIIARMADEMTGTRDGIISEFVSGDQRWSGEVS